MDVVAGYQLEALIGRGSSSTVWRARRHGPVARIVALKRCGLTGDADAGEQLRREAALLAELDHPHIVDVLDVLDDGDGVAIAMQLARGGSLRDLLHHHGPLSPGEVVAVVGPVADALASAHRRGLSHGDVKPENILFSGDGEPLLSDFGIAVHVAEAIRGGSPVPGTAPYLDPELLGGAIRQPSSDLYALGVVCYEALLGRVPHEGRDNEILAAAAEGKHRRLTDVAGLPPALADLVERTISPLTLDRPASAEDFADQLRASVDPRDVRLPGVAASGGAAHASIDAASVPADHRDRGTRLFGPRPPSPVVEAAPTRWMVLVTLCLLTVALGGALWWGRQRAAGPPATAGAAVRKGPCPSFPPIDTVPGADRFDADVNGDGCSVPLVWDGEVLVARFHPAEKPRAYRLGRHGDIVLFGDWDCDGTQTPALYRPAEGAVLYLNSFAPRVGDRRYADRVVAGPAHARHPRVVRRAGRCDAVRLS